MKKSNFAALMLGTVSGVFFALGMCMAMIPEWNMKNQGIVSGVIGIVLALITVGVWRKMEGKAPIEVSVRMVLATLLGIVGALMLGVDMCLSMIFAKMAIGIVVGIIGIAALIMLIPLLKGLHD